MLRQCRLWQLLVRYLRVNFLSDERAAGIGWVNTYADGGLRNGYNNEA